MNTLWALMLVLIAGASIFVPVVVVVYSLRLRSLHDPKACALCGYSKQGAESECCPECGHAWREKTHRRTTAKEEFMVFAALLGIPFIIFFVLLVVLVFAA